MTRPPERRCTVAPRFLAATVAWLALACAPGSLPAQRPADATSPPILRPARHELTLAVDFEARKLTATSRITLANETSHPVREASFVLYRLLTVRAARDGEGS